MSLISNIKDRDWVSVRQANARLGSSKLGPKSSPTFLGVKTTSLTITGLTDNSLVYPVSGLLTSLGVATDGQLPIGSTGAVPVLTGLTGTANQVTVTNGTGTITLSVPQDIHTGASPVFDGLTLSSIAAEATDVDKFLVSNAGLIKYRTGAETLGDIGGQAQDAGLDSLASLVYAADSFIKVTATDTYAIRTIAETKTDLGLDNVSNVATSDTAYDVSTWDANTDAATKNAIRDKFVTSDAAVALNTTHSSSDGSDHSIVGSNTTAIALNTTHRSSVGTDHSDVGLNNTHRGSTGADHSYLDQAVTVAGSPTFAGLSLGTGELTTGSINRASDTLTLEVGGVAKVSVLSTGVTLAGVVTLPAETIHQLGANNFCQSNATTNYLYSGGTGGLIIQNAANTAPIVRISDAGDLSADSLGVVSTGTGKFSTLETTGVLTFATSIIHQVGGHNFMQGDATTTYMYSGGSGGFRIRNAANSAELFGLTDAGAATSAFDFGTNVTWNGGGHKFVQMDANTTYFYGGTSGGIVFRNAANSATNLTITDAGAINATGSYQVDGTQVVSNQAAAIANATDAATAITQLNDLLAKCRTHGLIAT